MTAFCSLLAPRAQTVHNHISLSQQCCVLCCCLYFAAYLPNAAGAEKQRWKHPYGVFRSQNQLTVSKAQKDLFFFPLIEKPNGESVELHPSAKAYERIYCESLLQDSLLGGDRSSGIPFHDTANPTHFKFMMHVLWNIKMTSRTQCGLLC